MVCMLQTIAKLPGVRSFVKRRAGAVADGVELRADGAVPRPDLGASGWAGFLFGGLGSSAGVSVNQKSALGVATVYACVDVLARTIASLPLHVYQRLPNGERQRAPGMPLYRLLHDAPNAEMTSADFRYAMQANLSLHQNAYAVIGRQRDGDIFDLVPWPATEVEFYRDATTRELTYQMGGSRLSSQDVLHLRGMTFDGVCSKTLVSSVKDVIGLAIALDRNAGTFFKNGSMPGGFVKTAGTLSAEAIERLRAQFTLTGENAHKVKVLEEGLDWQDGSRTVNKDAQFDESRDRQSREIARLFGVPAQKIGLISSQPRANAEQENLSFVVDTIRPICVRWEQALNARLFPRGSDLFAEFDLTGLLRGDSKTRAEYYALARQWGWMSVNEIRRAENMRGIGEDGDIYLQPMNMIDAEKNNSSEGNDDE